MTTAICLAASCATPANAFEPEKSSESETASRASTSVLQTPQQAIERATAFLIKDAAKWRNERGCVTCHHGAMSVWALSETKRQGYPVDAAALADIVSWTKERFVPRLSKPRDSRPGWNLVSVAGIYLGVMSQDLPILSRGEVNQLAIHLARHQEEDGSWLMPPPSNGAPPTWESPETIVLLALLAWEPYVPVDPQEAVAARAARDKAVTWLAKAKPSETTQAMSLRLVLDVRSGKTSEQLQPQIQQLLSRQNSDGGWRQTEDMPCDAYATGQTLWALGFAGIDGQRAEIQRAVAFLTANQREDGSWPMTSRNHPEVKTTRNPIRNPMPITYFGSTWATLGLVRFVPPSLDIGVRRQLAFDSIRTFAGKHEVDDKYPDKPVVSVKVVYEVDDEELAGLTKLLTAFPKLTTLQFKSGRITDAGMACLKNLPQLRNLALENAPITDAGLIHLEALPDLQELNLKGTKVTEEGIKGFQKALPQAKVEH